MDFKKLLFVSVVGLLVYNTYLWSLRNKVSGGEIVNQGYSSDNNKLLEELNSSITRTKKAIEAFVEAKLKEINTRIEDLDNDFALAEINALRHRLVVMEDKMKGQKRWLQKQLDTQEEALMDLADEIDRQDGEIEEIKQGSKTKSPPQPPVPKEAVVDLRRWFNEWNKSSPVVPPLHDKVYLYVSSSNDIVSNSILATGAWVST